MKRFSISSWILCLGFWLTNGCSKEPPTPAPGQGTMVTQVTSAEATSTYADANLAELTRELRRWVVATREKPASFEDFAAKSKIKVPPPPAGKKYAFSPEMRVILVNR
jgi:hypothetical protein